MLVADPVERCELAFGQRRRSFQHGIDDLEIVAEFGNAHDMVEDEALVGDGTLEGHGCIP